MTLISWKQIDTDGNGYVNGNESSVAKEKGVANVWDYMTESDYTAGTTREQKLDLIKKQFSVKPSTLMYSASYKLDNLDNELLRLHNEYEKYKNETCGELKTLYAQKDYDFKNTCRDYYVSIIGILNPVLGLFGTNIDTTSTQSTLQKQQQIQNRINEIENRLSEMEENMRYINYVKSLKNDGEHILNSFK